MQYDIRGGRSGPQARVVVIGGGTGLPRMLNGLIETNAFVQAGVTTFDNGGDAGKFRVLDDSPSFGDLSRAAVPFSPRVNVTRRFERVLNYCGGPHKLRNIKTSQLFNGCDRDFASATERMNQWLGVQSGLVLPTSFEAAQLCARLSNGAVIKGETNIDVPVHDGKLRITNIWLEPSVEANPAFVRALVEADYIVFSSGDLYTSVMAALLPTGIREAIRASRAEKILVLNLMTKYGETYGYRLEDFMEEYERFIGEDVIDRVLVNSTIPSAEMQMRYRGKHSQWIWVDNVVEYYRNRLVFKPLLENGELARHDPMLIRDAFQSIFDREFVSHPQLMPKLVPMRA